MEKIIIDNTLFFRHWCSYLDLSDILEFRSVSQKFKYKIDRSVRIHKNVQKFKSKMMDTLQYYTKFTYNKSVEYHHYIYQAVLTSFLPVSTNFIYRFHILYSIGIGEILTYIRISDRDNILRDCISISLMIDNQVYVTIKKSEWGKMPKDYISFKYHFKLGSNLLFSLKRNIGIHLPIPRDQVIALVIHGNIKTRPYINCHIKHPIITDVKNIRVPSAWFFYPMPCSLPQSWDDDINRLNDIIRLNRLNDNIHH